MGRFLLRRLANYVVLIIVATTLAYFVASLALNPRARYDGRNPPVPPAVNASKRAIGMWHVAHSS